MTHRNFKNFEEERFNQELRNNRINNSIESYEFFEKAFLGTLNKHTPSEKEICQSKSCTAIYKTRNTGMGNGVRGMQGTRGMLTRILGESRREFRGMFQEIPGNVIKDSSECY